MTDAGAPDHAPDAHARQVAASKRAVSRLRGILKSSAKGYFSAKEWREQKREELQLEEQRHRRNPDGR